MRSLGAEAPSLHPPRMGSGETLSARLGPYVVWLRFASPALRTLGDALALQAEAGETPDFHLSVEAGSSGSPAPSMVPADQNGDMIVTAGSIAYALWTGRLGSALHEVDRGTRQARYWTADERAIPAWERSRPFLPAIQAMMHDTPWAAVHAAGIAVNGKGVLLCGLGHAGKTSLALAALEAGWTFAGDDFVLLCTDGTPAIAPLYATARLRDDMVSRLPGLIRFRREVSNDEGDVRHELDLRAAGTIGSAALAAIVLVQRRGADAPRLERIGRTPVIAALSATTTVATPGYAAERLGKLMRLVAAFDPWRFEPGPDPSRALDCLSRLLA